MGFTIGMARRGNPFTRMLLYGLLALMLLALMDGVLITKLHPILNFTSVGGSAGRAR